MTASKWRVGMVMFFACAPITGTGWLTDAEFRGTVPATRLIGPAVPGAGTIAPPKAACREQRRTDLYGDGLPPGVLLRIGTVRLRHHDITHSLAVSRAGR